MIKKCRSCGSRNIIDILSFGDQYLSDFTKVERRPPQYPLDLVMCTDCTLVQLRETTPQNCLYTESYGYRSGINNTIQADLKEIVEKATKLVDLKAGDVVLDIGSNDATLLKNYSKDITRVGFDPIVKFKKYYNEPNLIFINDYFNKEKYIYPKAKIITAISCFYDLDEPNKFVEDIVDVLDENGIFIIQQNYLMGMLKQNAFDNIVHEHIEYYSLKSLENLLNKHELEISDVETNTINGGSFRTYIRHMNKLNQMRLAEERMKLGNKWTYLLFSFRVRDIVKKVHEYIENLNKQGKTIYLYGASTRGNSLIQACGLDNKLIKKAVERNPEKWGQKIASLQIPIISEEQARKEKPDYMLVLPWFFKEEFIEREKEYLKNGGHLIFPLPEFEVI